LDEDPRAGHDKTQPHRLTKLWNIGNRGRFASATEAGAGGAICPRDFDANPRIDGVKPSGAID
jgi:hypothetical protein